jgi:hypothetical protein
MIYPTDLVHIYIKFEDQFSGAINEKIVARSGATFVRMIEGIGTTFNHYDKKQGINYTWKVLEVRQATEQDYINTGTQYFVNQ